MKKRLIAMLIALCLLAAGTAYAEPAEAGFHYIHDPRENPSAMADIVEDASAVYGFRPSPDGSLKQYADMDWSDPELVEAGRQERLAYHESIEEMYKLLVDMKAEGATTEEIARAVSTKRNEIRLASYADDSEALEKAKARNLEQYGHEEGPLPEESFEKYGTWQKVLEKAFSTNSGMDACLGLYDDYYELYIAAGQIPADAGETAAISADTPAAENAGADYTLEQVVILSRHNLRAPLSSNGSVPSELTPHEWIEWTANASELTLLGGLEETSMGQYFKKWLDQEGLIPENYVPEEGEMRFNARNIQRCIATARYFAAGMLPLADIEVEHPGDDKGTEDFMAPVLHFYSDDYAADAIAQVAAMGGDAGFEGISEQIRGAVELVMDTVDMADSEIYQSGKYGDLLSDASGYIMEEEGKEPDLTGAIKPIYQVGDALILQYYEEPDAVRAAFGHELTDEDWAKLGEFMTTCLQIKHGAPLVAANITNPLLVELKGELENENRKFSFFCAHDCTVLGTLSALGAEPYSLPESIENMTPVGVKLMFEKLRDGEGQVWYRVSLVYRSTEQIRSGEMLTLDNPPMKYDLRFEGVATNEDGLIAEADLIALFDDAIGKLGEMEEMYALENAA